MNKILVIFLALIALGSVGIGCSADSDDGSGTVDAPILSPTQDNAVDNQNDNTNAQGQSQDTDVSNDNTNTNNNNNQASSSSDNNVNVQNDNYITNYVYVTATNAIHDITASSRNTNLQFQGTSVDQANIQGTYAKSTSVFVPGSCPMVMATVPTNNSSAAAGGENVGMQETGFNFTSLLMGIIGVMGGLLATRFRSL